MNYAPDYYGAYYSVTQLDENGHPYLWGSARIHSIKCSDDVYYIRLAKTLHPSLHTDDPRGEFVADFQPVNADYQASMLAFLAGTDDLSAFHHVTQAILQQDISAGMDRETILEKRAGIMAKEFLGFTPDHVFMVKPELAGSDTAQTEDGDIEVLRFKPGSWWEEDL